MFKDLKKGYQVYTLDTSGVPKFFMGTVVNVSEPRFAQSQLGQYQQLQDRVMDLTIEVDGKSMTYVVPENQNVAMANGITLACSVDPIMNHLNAMKRTSTDIVNSVDKNKEIIEACDSILEDINPTFKQTKDPDDPDYKRYIDTHGYHFSKELAREAADKMLNADGSKRRWTMEDAKQMFDKCGAKKPDNATWGDVQYLFAMFYSDYFPKVLDCDQKIVKAVLAYLEDPDAPEGAAFVRYLAVRCFVGDTIKWSEMI